MRTYLVHLGWIFGLTFQALLAGENLYLTRTLETKPSCDALLVETEAPPKKPVLIAEDPDVRILKEIQKANIPDKGFPAIDPNDPVLQKNIAIVDAFSSAKLKSGTLLELGFKKEQLIHIRSPYNIPGDLVHSLPAHEFGHHYLHQTDEQTLSFLGNFNLGAIFIGTETAVVTASELSEQAGLTTNGAANSMLFRDKYLMGQKVKELAKKGIIPYAARDGLASTFDQVREWQKTVNEDEWPFVMKPRDSAGTDGFHLCRNLEEAYRAFHDLIGKKTAFDAIIDQVYLQEFLPEAMPGAEHVWDGSAMEVSPRTIPAIVEAFQGYEYLLPQLLSREVLFVESDLWHYFKTTATRNERTTKLYGYDGMLPFEGQIQDELRALAIPISRELGARNGDIHLEAMYTNKPRILKEIGSDKPIFVLVEAALRQAGTNIPGSVRRALGRSQVQLGIYAYLFPKQFLYWYQQQPLSVRDLAVNIDLISNGGFLRPGFEEEIKDLPCYWSHGLHLKEGEELPVTTNLLNSPGTVFLVCDDEAKREVSRKKVRELELKYYTVDPMPERRALPLEEQFNY